MGRARASEFVALDPTHSNLISLPPPLVFLSSFVSLSLCLTWQRAIVQVDESTLFLRAWPRACAVAERLWSPRHVNNVATAWPRLARQRCRMEAAGIPVTPLGPGDDCSAVAWWRGR